MIDQSTNFVNAEARGRQRSGRAPVAVHPVRFAAVNHSPIPRRLAALAAALLVAVVVAACSGGSQAPVSFDPNAPQITATNQTFDKAELDLPADKGFELVFFNNDSQTHNVSIYSDEGYSQRVFGGDLVGGGTHVYHVQALAPGTYWFRCDVHTDMKGVVKVGAG
jgi:plastocyanin